MNRIYLSAVLLFSAAAIAQGRSAPEPSALEGPGADAGMAAKPAKEGKPTINVEAMHFSQESVKRVIAAHQDEIQSCYEETLAGKDKPVEGKIMTSFVITPEGMVREARILKQGTTLKDRKLHDCVVATLGSLSFPKPPDGKDHPVQYPYNLKASR
jgi:hypothetical protein